MANYQERVEVEPPPQLPVDGKGYFACRQCRRILNETQWYTEGCADCATGKIGRGELMEYATPNFTNFIGLVAPSQSWVGRLIGKTSCSNGVFAEVLSDDDEDDMDEEEDPDAIDEDNEGEGETIRQGVNELEEIEAI